MNGVRQAKICLQNYLWLQVSPLRMKYSKIHKKCKTQAVSHSASRFHEVYCEIAAYGWQFCICVHLVLAWLGLLYEKTINSPSD